MNINPWSKKWKLARRFSDPFLGWPFGPNIGVTRWVRRSDRPLQVGDAYVLGPLTGEHWLFYDALYLTASQLQSGLIGNLEWYRGSECHRPSSQRLPWKLFLYRYFPQHRHQRVMVMMLALNLNLNTVSLNCRVFV